MILKFRPEIEAIKAAASARPSITENQVDDVVLSR